MSTQETVAGARARSISHNEIVTVEIGSEESMQDAFDALTADELCDKYDYTDATATLREVYGTDESGNEWRVHLTQRERVGCARFHE